MLITERRNLVRNSTSRSFNRQCRLSSLLLLLTILATNPTHADGEIRVLITSSVAATPSTVIVDGADYRWGQEENLLLDGFIIGNDEYTPNLKANSVSVLRRDIPGVAIGELCGVFAERQGSTGNDVKPGFSSLANHTGICDMSAMLMSSIINRGTLDTFTNTGLNPNNIERLDFKFDGGIVAPSDPEFLSSAGHAIGEKHGNNRVQVAAILTLDGSGTPAQYGPLVSIGGVDMCAAGEICYGETSLVHDYLFIKSRSLEPLSDLQEVDRIREPVAFAFLSMEKLGISAGGIYYGISVFPHDINVTDHNLLDISSFPVDTEEPEVSLHDSADIYGGSASLYSIPSGVSGRVFCQANAGGTEPAANQPISLFRDTLANGVLDELQDQLVAQLPGTTTEGQYSFLGLENGSYFVAVKDSTDDDLTSLAVVIDSSPVNDADITLDNACRPIGPKAFPDMETMASASVSIAVLENDENADGMKDAPDINITKVSESDTAEMQILGRTVLYTPTAAFRSTATEDIPAIETFTYMIADAQGLTSETTVTITIIPPDDDHCTAPLPPACLFVETEVEGIGVGRIPPLASLLLLTFVVMRRYAQFATSSTSGGMS